MCIAIVGTIISSAVGPKISLPIEMNVETHLLETNNSPEMYDKVEEEDDEELYSNQMINGHQNEEQEEVVDEEEAEEEQVESEEAYVPPKQSDEKDQSFAAHYANSPPLYPNPYQYAPYMNPNMPQFPMQRPGAPMPPGFNPFNYNYYAALSPPTPSPSNDMQESNVVTPKPAKKKIVKNSNNRPMAITTTTTTTTTEKPDIENDSIVHMKPSKPNQKEKPTAPTNPNQVYASGLTYSSAAIPFLGQNQILPVSPINSFNTHPFNNQFSMPFYPKNDAPSSSNYINPSMGFNAANDFPSQFGQTNPMNPYANNPFAGKQYSAAQYANNPNFNVPKTQNSPFTYQSVNQFNQKFNGYPQYFANPPSNNN